MHAWICVLLVIVESKWMQNLVIVEHKGLCGVVAKIDKGLFQFLATWSYDGYE